MIEHYKKADYIKMPWVSGKGETTQIYRREQNNFLHWQITLDAVVTNGPFSHISDTMRSLTVISGKGFDIVSEEAMRAAPLKPIPFNAAISTTAENVQGKCNYFNMMWNFGLPRPDIYVLQDERKIIQPHEGQVAIFAVKSSKLEGIKMARHDMILTSEPVEFISGTVICVGMEFY